MVYLYQMSLTSLLFGIVIGLLLAIFVAILFFSKTKDNLERAVKKLVGRRASIINTVDPIDEIEL